MSLSPSALIFIAQYPSQLYSYAIPPTLLSQLHPGSLVTVPFGRAVQTGMLIEISEGEEPQALELVTDLVDNSFVFPDTSVALARWIASYYLCPLGTCLQRILPAPFRHGVKEHYLITPFGRMMAAGSGRGRATQHAILTTLQAAKRGLSGQSLRRTLGTRNVASAIESLQTKGHITAKLNVPAPTKKKALRKSDSGTNPHALVDLQLPSPLASALRRPGHSRTFILQAPESYRTWMYLMAIQETMKKGRSSLIVFPHAAHARAFAKVISDEVGDHISDFSGTATPSKQLTEWQRIRSGEATVIIGTGSVLLSPVDKLGLVILDEEHDFRHKAYQEPRYHARDIALARATKESATVILGSLHPSVEAIHLSHSKKATALERPMAHDVDYPSDSGDKIVVDCIDMTTAQRRGRLFSERMITAIEARLHTGQTVMLFQPRRGFSRSLWCRDCGTTTRCSQCSVALTYYKQAGTLLCHLCGESRPAPDVCSACSGRGMTPMGFGTEGVEAETRVLFPDARIMRIDRDLVRSPSGLSTFVKDLERNGVDILIGTPMLFDLMPAPQVSLIGVLSADMMLHMPDFRAAERVFHQLLQLKGLLQEGELLIQALQADHPVLESVCGSNPQHFYKDELATRRELSFPPFTRLVCLRVIGDVEDHVHMTSSRWADDLRERQNTGIQEVLGPIPAPYSRVRGQYRDQILLKEPSSGLAAELAHSAVEATLRTSKTLPSASGLSFEVDVDPQVFL